MGQRTKTRTNANKQGARGPKQWGKQEGTRTRTRTSANKTRGPGRRTRTNREQTDPIPHPSTALCFSSSPCVHPAQHFSFIYRAPGRHRIWPPPQTSSMIRPFLASEGIDPAHHFPHFSRHPGGRPPQNPRTTIEPGAARPPEWLDVSEYDVSGPPRARVRSPTRQRGGR